MAKSESVQIKIEAHSESGVDLLPDVLRQLNAMVKLLQEFSTDPTLRVEVRSLKKGSPLEAELRIVKIKPRAKAKVGAVRKRAAVQTYTQPIRRFERVYATITEPKRTQHKDAEGLAAITEFAKQLKDDVATITTGNQTMVVNKSIIEQVNTRLGPVHRAHGTVTGVLEGLNVHGKGPWQFVVYPEIGPSKVRCYFDESLFLDVQNGIRHIVTVRGMKDFVAGSPWPICMKAEHIEILEEAKPGAWLELVKNLEDLWDTTSDEDRVIFLEEHSA